MDGQPQSLPATQPVPVYEVRRDGDEVVVTDGVIAMSASELLIEGLHAEVGRPGDPAGHRPGGPQRARCTP